MKIVLRSRLYQIASIKKKTSAKGFSTFKKGDLIQIQLPDINTHSGSSTNFLIYNLSNDVRVAETGGRVGTRLSSFELVEEKREI